MTGSDCCKNTVDTITLQAAAGTLCGGTGTTAVVLVEMSVEPAVEVSMVVSGGGG